MQHRPSPSKATGARLTHYLDSHHIEKSCWLCSFDVLHILTAVILVIFVLTWPKLTQCWWPWFLCFFSLQSKLIYLCSSSYFDAQKRLHQKVENLNSNLYFLFLKVVQESIRHVFSDKKVSDSEKEQSLNEIRKASFVGYKEAICSWCWDWMFLDLQLTSEERGYFFVVVCVFWILKTCVNISWPRCYDWQGHFRLGEAQFALRDYPSAEKAYAKASELVSAVYSYSGRMSGVSIGCNWGMSL